MTATSESADGHNPFVAKVTLGVEPDAQVPRVLQNAFAHVGIMLADATGEDDRVHPVQCHRRSADEPGRPIGKHVQRERAIAVALLHQIFDFPDVMVVTDTLEPAAFVQDRIHLVGRHTEFLDHENWNVGIESLPAGSP